MRTQSPSPLNKFEVMGKKLRIHFNEVEKIEQDEEGSEYTVYVYDTAVSNKLEKRDRIIEDIMATRYETYGAELAAIQNGGSEQEEHQKFREMAKSLADEWVAQR